MPKPRDTEPKCPAAPDDATLECWRADADRWQRYGLMPADETRLATQRIATLIAALREARDTRLAEPPHVFGGLIAPDAPALSNDELLDLRHLAAETLGFSGDPENTRHTIARLLDAHDLLAAALREARAAGAEIENELIPKVNKLAAEISPIVAELHSLLALQQRVELARETVFGRRPFSAAPAIIEPAHCDECGSHRGHSVGCSQGGPR